MKLTEGSRRLKTLPVSLIQAFYPTGRLFLFFWPLVDRGHAGLVSSMAAGGLGGGSPGLSGALQVAIVVIASLSSLFPAVILWLSTDAAETLLT